MAHTVLHSPYLAALDDRVLVFDGAMGTSLDQFALTTADYGGTPTEGCRDYLVISRPDVITQVHTAFLDAGCDVIETCTFQATRLRLDEWGLGDQTDAINRQAAQLARSIADRFVARDGRQRFVAGSIGPTGKLPSLNDPLLSDIGFGALIAIFTEQAHALIGGGVDVLLIETSQDMLEVKAAVLGCRQAIAAAERPIALQVQITLDSNGRMLLGTDIASALTTIAALDVDVVGLNCSTGPEQMYAPIRYLTTQTTLPVSCLPNAGIPINVNGQATYPLEPEAMAAMLGAFVHDLGVRVVGGCCGSTPEHIHAIANVVRQRNRARCIAPREPHNSQRTATPAVSSSVCAVSFEAAVGPIIVGTRLHSRWSARVRRLLLSNDDERLLHIAREQQQQGAQVLSVCVDLPGHPDEGAQMVRLVRRLTQEMEPPLLLESSNAAVLEAALQIYPGRPILGGAPLDALFMLAARYGAAVICQVGNDPEHDETLRACQRFCELATQAGVPPDALIIAVQTVPLIAEHPNRTAAAWALESVRLIKQRFPGSLTCLDVNDLTVGMTRQSRAVFTTVFLEHAVGLDLALVNPQHLQLIDTIAIHERSVCTNLLLNRHPDALTDFIQHYEVAEVAARSLESR